MITSTHLQAGIDEAGRGPLVGPVFAAAVILPAGFEHPLLNDSKKVSKANREILRVIIEREAVAWAVEMVDAAEIDSINILEATYKAMNKAVENLTTQPVELLIDGNRFKSQSSIPYQTIIKGDSKHTCIAAASILAKTHRDEYMMQLDAEYPQYDWRNNMGYPTLSHKQAIAKHGLTPHHRLSFKGCKP